MVTFVHNEKLLGHEKEYDAIIVSSDINCTMSHGYSYYVGTLFPYAFDANMSTKYGDRRKLGTIIEASKEGCPTFIIAFIIKRFFGRNVDYLSYESLEKCLSEINRKYKGKKLACKFLGTAVFDGNGNKERVRKIFEDTMKDVDLTIYDKEQLTREEMYWRTKQKYKRVQKANRNEYYKLIKKGVSISKKIKEMNGRRGFIFDYDD